MSPAPYTAKLYLLLTYIALSCVPFIPVMMGKSLARPWQVLGMEVVAWVVVWAVFRRPARFHWLLLPAFLALPVEIYLYIYYGQGISTHHLGIIAETSPSEAMEFLGSTVWLLLASVVGVLAWWATSWKAALRAQTLDWQDSSRIVALVLMGGAAAVWAWGVEFGIEAKPAAPVAASAPASLPAAKTAIHRAAHVVSAPAPITPAKKASVPKEDKAVAGAAYTGLKWPPLPHAARLPVDVNALANSWPFGIVLRSIDFYKERQHLLQLGERNKHFTFNARQAQADDKPEIVVMVIGESSRFDRWSLNGYARQTNPLLEKEANLVTFKDLITSVSATRLSVPVIISRKTAMQSLRDGFSEKSFLTAYKEAGFKTYWLSNQVSFGEFDTPVSVFAKEADVVQFLNLGGFTNDSNFDQVLFAPFKAAIADPAPKKLVVLHTLGSHWNYSHRYPPNFDRWKPSLKGLDRPAYTDKKMRQHLNNSYDNSILYTDWFLANVIGMLRQSEQRSAMLYVADHGQTLFDKTCSVGFHGHNTQYEFHVPAMLWYSDLYAARHPAKVGQLRKHRNARLTTENVFHTLLDLGDVHYAGERLERSIVDARFREHTRYVDSYGWTNYDNAIIRGDCREVIDKGKPLKQEK